SPWADGAGDAVPKEALPSALAPGVAPPVTVAPPVHDEARRPREFSLRSAVLAILAVFVPLALMWFFFVRPHGPSIENDRSPKALPTAPWMITPQATVTVTPTAEPAMPASSATSASPGSSALPTTSATPAPSAPPVPKPKGLKHPPVKQAAPAPTDE